MRAVAVRGSLKARNLHNQLEEEIRRMLVDLIFLFEFMAERIPLRFDQTDNAFDQELLERLQLDGRCNVAKRR